VAASFLWLRFLALNQPDMGGAGNPKKCGRGWGGLACPPGGWGRSSTHLGQQEKGRKGSSLRPDLSHRAGLTASSNHLTFSHPLGLTPPPIQTPPTPTTALCCRRRLSAAAVVADISKFFFSHCNLASTSSQSSTRKHHPNPPHPIFLLSLAVCTFFPSIFSISIRCAFFLSAAPPFSYFFFPATGNKFFPSIAPSRLHLVHFDPPVCKTQSFFCSHFPIAVVMLLLLLHLLCVFAFRFGFLGFSASWPQRESERERMSLKK